MLATPLDVLRARAEMLVARHASCSIVDSRCALGGGTTPTETIASIAHRSRRATRASCRRASCATTRRSSGRVQNDRFTIDVRTLQESDLTQVAAALSAVGAAGHCRNSIVCICVPRLVEQAVLVAQVRPAVSIGVPTRIVTAPGVTRQNAPTGKMSNVLSMAIGTIGLLRLDRQQERAALKRPHLAISDRPSSGKTTIVFPLRMRSAARSNDFTAVRRFLRSMGMKPARPRAQPKIGILNRLTLAMKRIGCGIAAKMHGMSR